MAITAIVNFPGTNKIYAFQGNQYSRLTQDGSTAPAVLDSGYPKQIAELPLPVIGDGPIDAAYTLGTSSSRILFVKGTDVVVFRCASGLESGISNVNTTDLSDKSALGIPFAALEDGMDAAALTGFSHTHYFRGTEYFHFNVPFGPAETLSIDALPWGGFAADGVDAVLSYGRKTFVFAGDEYIRFDSPSSSFSDVVVDPGFPLPIARDWPFGFDGVPDLSISEAQLEELIQPDAFRDRLRSVPPPFKRLKYEDDGDGSFVDEEKDETLAQYVAFSDRMPEALRTSIERLATQVDNDDLVVPLEPEALARLGLEIDDDGNLVEKRFGEDIWRRLGLIAKGPPYFALDIPADDIATLAKLLLGEDT